MAGKDILLETPPFRDDYVLVEVDDQFLLSRVKPKQFIHIDEAECIACEGCVDICPWKCIHMLSTDIIAEAENTRNPADDPAAGYVFVIDDDECTRCSLCVDRCPTGVIIMGKFGVGARGADAIHQRAPQHNVVYGMKV